MSLTAFLLPTLIVIVVSVVLILGTFVWLKRGISGSVGAESENISSEITDLTKKIEDLLQYKESYASKGQFDNLMGVKTQLSTELEKEKSGLKEIESRLEKVQKSVEEKEFQQQDVKSSKAEDETKLEDVISKHPALSSECTAIEQKVAANLKQLDAFLAANPTYNDGQKGLIIDVQNALSVAGATLRDLIGEYDSVLERLNMLKEQHADLEGEYTKLVEAQLGD